MSTLSTHRGLGVEIQAGSARLQGELLLPGEPLGVVLFAHGSGSSRHSPRNALVARALFDAGLGTLLFDLLTAAEDRDYATRFDIALLSARLIAATDWLVGQPVAAGLSIGYFGASTGAAAALVAAGELSLEISAVVSRGGRPDLAGKAVLGRVRAPTLLIVGGEDREVIALNHEALGALRCEKNLRIVPGATHLFEEAGTLEQVSALAVEWFRRWLAPARAASGEARRN